MRLPRSLRPPAHFIILCLVPLLRSMSLWAHQQRLYPRRPHRRSAHIKQDTLVPQDVSVVHRQHPT